MVNRIGFSERARGRGFELKEIDLKISAILAAIVVVVVGALALPKTAQAAPAYQTQGGITCHNQNISGTTWPGTNFWYCGQSNADFGPTDAGYLADQGAYAKTALFNKGVKVFVFQTSATFVTFCNGSVTYPVGANPLIPVNECFTTAQLQYVRGLSTTGPTAQFPYSVVVETYTDSYTGKTVNDQPPLGKTPSYMPC